MRLRPSGRQGPVATSLASYVGYQRDQAWTWEHLALTRARPVSGNEDLGAEVEAFRRELIAHGWDREGTLADVAEMRVRLDRAKPGQGIWDAKSGPGRLQDIALLAETGALLSGSPERDIPGQIAAGAGELGMSASDVSDILNAHTLFWSIQAASRLLSEVALDPAALGEGGRGFLLRETGARDMRALEQHIVDAAGRAAEIIGRCLPNQGDADGPSFQG